MTQLDDAERQLLEYLADQPRGGGLVCQPDLVEALRRLVFHKRHLISDVYEGSEGAFIARITYAGRQVLNQQEPPKAWLEAKKEIDDGWPDPA